MNRFVEVVRRYFNEEIDAEEERTTAAARALPLTTEERELVRQSRTASARSREAPVGIRLPRFPYGWVEAFVGEPDRPRGRYDDQREQGNEKQNSYAAHETPSVTWRPGSTDCLKRRIVAAKRHNHRP